MLQTWSVEEEFSQSLAPGSHDGQQQTGIAPANHPSRVASTAKSPWRCGMDSRSDTWHVTLSPAIGFWTWQVTLTRAMATQDCHRNLACYTLDNYPAITECSHSALAITVISQWQLRIAIAKWHSHKMCSNPMVRSIYLWGLNSEDKD